MVRHDYPKGPHLRVADETATHFATLPLETPPGDEIREHGLQGDVLGLYDGTGEQGHRRCPCSVGMPGRSDTPEPSTPKTESSSQCADPVGERRSRPDECSSDTD